MEHGFLLHLEWVVDRGLRLEAVLPAQDNIAYTRLVQCTYSVHFEMSDNGEGPRETHKGSKWRNLHLNGPILVVLDSVCSSLLILHYHAR